VAVCTYHERQLSSRVVTVADVRLIDLRFVCRRFTRDLLTGEVDDAAVCDADLDPVVFTGTPIV